MTRRRAVRGRCPECTDGLCDWYDGRLRANRKAADLDFAEQVDALQPSPNEWQFDQDVARRMDEEYAAEEAAEREWMRWLAADEAWDRGSGCAQDGCGEHATQGAFCSPRCRYTYEAEHCLDRAS